MHDGGEGAAQRNGRGEQHDGEHHLRGHQGVSNGARAAHIARTARTENVDAAGVERRKHAKEQATEQGDGDGKCQHASIEQRVRLAGQRGRLESGGDGRGGEGRGEPREGGGQRQQYALGEQLLGDAGAAGA